MKRLTTIPLMAALLLITSCNNGQESPLQDSTVQINLTSLDRYPQNMQLTYGLYPKNGNSAVSRSAGTEIRTLPFPAGTSPVIDIPLNGTETYDIILWLQPEDCKAFNTEDLKSVSIDYSKFKGTEDIWYAVLDDVSSRNGTPLKIDLHSPFTQVSVLTSPEDAEAAARCGLDVDSIRSEVVFNQCPDVFHPFSGTVSYSGNTKSLNIPSFHSPDSTFTTEKGSYRYLSTVRFFSEKKQTASFNVMLHAGGFDPISVPMYNVPVERESCINILGEYLTADVTFNITIEPGFEGEENVSNNQ